MLGQEDDKDDDLAARIGELAIQPRGTRMSVALKAQVKRLMSMRELSMKSFPEEDLDSGARLSRSSISALKKLTQITMTPQQRKMVRHLTQIAVLVVSRPRTVVVLSLIFVINELRRLLLSSILLSSWSAMKSKSESLYCTVSRPP